MSDPRKYSRSYNKPKYSNDPRIRNNNNQNIECSRDPRIRNSRPSSFNDEPPRKKQALNFNSTKIENDSENLWIPIDAPPKPTICETEKEDNNNKPNLEDSSASSIENYSFSKPNTIPFKDKDTNFTPILPNTIKLESDLTINSHTLPITAHRREILKTIYENQVVIISGDTGSGKSTQVPRYIYEECITRNQKCSIICSQPRRIAATSLARRVSSEMNSTVGELVGYQISMDKTVSSSTKILFCTTGILLERLVHQKYAVRNFTHIIIDEVHERSLEIDLCLILLKKNLPKNPKIRIILMSATFDCLLFANYFPLQQSLSKKKYFSTEHLISKKYAFSEGYSDITISAPILEVQGRCFSVNLYYIEDVYNQLGVSAVLKNECENSLFEHRTGISKYMYELAVELVINIDNQNPNNRELESILIFLPGFGEIRNLYELFAKKVSYNFWLIPLHSSIKHEEQAKIFQSKDGYRKIVLATNIAESSITVPDVRFVIDFGLFKESYFDPDTNLESLRMEWCSRANLDQRKGRAGRVRAGFVYRLFDREFFNELPEYSKPEILRSPLENLILSIKVYGENVSLLSLALDPPDLSGVVNSVENLREAGALTLTNGDLMNVLDDSCKVDPAGEITHLGILYSKLPLHFRVSRMLFLTYIFGLLEEGIIMAACMSVRSPFELPIRPSLDGFTQKLEYADSTNSDSLASLNVYREWKHEKELNNWSFKQKRRWETQRHVRGKTLEEIEELIIQLTKRLKENNIQIPESLTSEINDNDSDTEEDEDPIDLDRGRSRSRNFENRSPSRSLSPYQKPLSKKERILLVSLLFGSFYPNYLQTEIKDENTWTFACNHYEDLDYDPTRTVELHRLPEEATESDLKDLFYKCGRVDFAYIENSKGYVQFKKTRETPNLSVIKALKLATIRKLSLGFEDDYRRYERSRKRNTRFTNSNPSNQLAGPYNPFQVSFASVISKLRTYIPRDSINSVSIDTSFEYSPRYLVACFILKSPKNANTIANETTILPPIPLLAPLLSLIFVPSSDVIFRTNKNYNKYLGVLIGKKLEYDFDAILTKQDLDDINTLRKAMNDSLTAEGIKSPNFHLLKRLLFNIITRERVPLKRRPAPGSFLWKSFDGRELSYSDASRSYKPRDGFQKQDDFLPLEVDQSYFIFPPIKGVTPPLETGYDYDSEEEFRQSMVTKIETFEKSIFNLDNNEITRDEPEIVCQNCKAPIAEISKLEVITNPFTSGIAWRLLKSFGYVFATDIEDDKYTRKLRKPITRISCSENHFIGWSVDGVKIITPDSELEIHGMNNEVILWNSAAWSNSFGMFKNQLNSKKKQLSYSERLIQPKEFTCPCCKITVNNKKEIFTHLNSKKHKQEKEEVFRKNKYARPRSFKR